MRPFWHKVLFRKAGKPRRWTRFILSGAAAGRDTPLPSLLSVETILKRLARPGSVGVVLSASHDNYREIQGGTQLCIQREERLAIARGLVYLHFSPCQALPCLAPAGDGADLAVTILIDGELIGRASMASLTAAIRHHVAAGRVAKLVVHHLLGHSPEALAALAHVTGASDVPVWLHDFFTLCPSYTLQRNNLAFCGAPDARSDACGTCVHGPSRPHHQQRIATFFRSVPVIAVAPSQATADLWSTKSVDLPVRRVAVIPHIVLKERPRIVLEKVQAGGPVTVAYLGAPVSHKGWPVFIEMMKRHSGPDVRFVILSNERPGIGEDAWYEVRVTSETLDAMSAAIRRSRVDVVLHWPTWPETFSFTTFETLTAGAWILTNPVSGNVQAAVRATGHGAVLDDRTALDRLFVDGSLAKMAASRRALAARTEIVPNYSALSFDIPEWS